MNSQIYLMLFRATGAWPKDFSAMSSKRKAGAVAAVAAATILKQIPKDMVMGDSLDIPFMKFIRCDNVSHGLSFSGMDTQQVTKTTGDTAVTTTEDLNTGNKYQGYRDDPVRDSLFFQKTRFYGEKSFGDRFSKIHVGNHGIRESLGSWLGGNEFVKTSVPKHGEVVFTKSIDTATPQLAYGCAAQEQFPLAAFFYRRKAGLGLGGVRWPYFVMGLYKNKIKDWSLDGDTETVKLSYSAISWCGYDQWADTNISYPWSTRWFDQDAATGGQGGFAMVIQAVAAGLIMGAGAATAALTQ